MVCCLLLILTLTHFFQTRPSHKIACSLVCTIQPSIYVAMPRPQSQEATLASTTTIAIHTDCSYPDCPMQSDGCTDVTGRDILRLTAVAATNCHCSCSRRGRIGVNVESFRFIGLWANLSPITLSMQRTVNLINRLINATATAAAAHIIKSLCQCNNIQRSVPRKLIAHNIIHAKPQIN